MNDTEKVRLGPFRGHLLAWTLLAGVNGELIAWYVPWVRGAVAERAAVQILDAGQHFALGILSGAAAASWRRWGPRGVAPGLIALAALAVMVGEIVLVDDVSGPAGRLASGVSPRVAGLFLASLFSSAVPAAALVGRWLDRPRARGVTVLLSVALAALAGGLFPTSYAGVHLIVVWTVAVLTGTLLAGAPLPGWVRRGRETAALIVLCLVGAAALTLRPSNGALLQLLAAPNAILTPYLARMRSGRMTSVTDVPESEREWFVDRKGHPPIPSVGPSLLHRTPIVILISIDSVRAELLRDDRFADTLPELVRLRDESVRFSSAYAPGSSTGTSLASVFASSYYSQQYWTMKKAKDHSALYPHEDTSVRFPEVLSQRGVRTVNIASQAWLAGPFGVVRGFREEQVISEDSRYPSAARMVGPLIERLASAGEEPLFLFLHCLDPHSPYNSAGSKSTPFDGYVAEVGAVDRQLGVLRNALREKGLEDRTTLIVMADHGEAFGEHGKTWHASTLYDELLRVPLLIHVPGVAPREVENRVSLIDLAPTVLDLFGADTPGVYAGQSLVPYLRGRNPVLTRPILAEGRLKRALVGEDGFKVIEDSRSWTVELYDLGNDPRELRDLFVEEDEGSLHRLGILHAYFHAQTLRRPGYRVPYRN